MPQDNDPTKKFADATARYQKRLLDLWKSVLKKVFTRIKPMLSFVGTLITKGAQLVGKIGKGVFQTIQRTYNIVLKAIDAIPSMIKRVLRLGDKILALLRKAADPMKIIKALKSLFSRYVSLLKEVFAKVVDFMVQLDVLGRALAVINGLKAMLRLVFAWIVDVTRAVDAIGKAKKILRTVVKEMKKEIKEATKLRKEVMQLKAA